MLNVRERNEVSIGSGYSQKVPLWQMFRKHTLLRSYYLGEFSVMPLPCDNSLALIPP